MEENSIVCGDFNLCGTWDENRIIPSDYIDLWSLLHPDLPGWTEDTQINKMRYAASGGRHKQVRFDRILCHHHVSADGGDILGKSLQPESIELVGIRPIDDDDDGNDNGGDNNNSDPLWPSDHFGLFARFSC
jgi:tyrosyl-DNA phosphodiesterase 2